MRVLERRSTDQGCSRKLELEPEGRSSKVAQLRQRDKLGPVHKQERAVRKTERPDCKQEQSVRKTVVLVVRRLERPVRKMVGLVDRKMVEPADRKTVGLVVRKMAGLVDHKMVEPARKKGLVVRKKALVVRKKRLVDRKLEENKPEQVAHTEADRKQEPWRKPVQMKLLRKPGQVQSHTKMVAKRKPGQERLQNTAEEECKEKEQGQQEPRTPAVVVYKPVGEQLRKFVVEGRPVLEQLHKIAVGEHKPVLQELHRVAVGGKPVLEQHRKIVVVEHKQMPLGQSRTIVVAVVGKQQPGQSRKAEGRPVLVRHRIRVGLPHKLQVGERKQPELRQRTLLLRHKMVPVDVARKMEHNGEPEPVRNLPQVGGQRE